MKYTVHTKESAPAASKEIIDEVIKTYGFLPNLYGIMAEAPMAGKTYMTLNNILEQTSLSATEIQTVLLTASYVNECTYCVAAHTVVAGMKKVPDDVVQAIRAGKPISDSKLEALRAFTASVTETRGWPEDSVKEAFFDAGYTKAQALEVIIGVATKTLTNYINHLADTPLDEAFRPAEWKTVKAA